MELRTILSTYPFLNISANRLNVERNTVHQLVQQLFREIKIEAQGSLSWVKSHELNPGFSVTKLPLRAILNSCFLLDPDVCFLKDHCKILPLTSSLSLK